MVSKPHNTYGPQLLRRYNALLGGLDPAEKSFPFTGRMVGGREKTNTNNKKFLQKEKHKVKKEKHRSSCEPTKTPTQRHQKS